MQVESSVCTWSAYQSRPSSQTRLSRGAGLQEEGGASERSANCKELLMKTEFSFEELRAERLIQQRRQQLDDELGHLMENKQLSLELQEKKKLLQLKTSQLRMFPEGSSSQIRDTALPASFQIYDESQPAAAARPAGNELLDDVFLCPDETGLCLRVTCPRPDQREPRPPVICQKDR